MSHKANITWLTDDLATGGDLSYDPDIAADQILDILDQGITHIIDLRMEDDDTLLWGPHGVWYWNLGTNDANGHHIPAELFDRVVELARQARNEKGKVLVHCHMGVNRGPSAAAAVLMDRGMGAIEAFDLIREKRPQAAVYYLMDAYDAHTARVGLTPAPKWGAGAAAHARSLVEKHWEAEVGDPDKIAHVRRYIGEMRAADRAAMKKGARPFSR